MTSIIPHPLALDGKDPTNLRGDAITADRYYSREFMRQEWEQLWTKIWHVAGRENQLEEAGDYIVHNFMRESVFIVKQEDGSLKGFYNACRHRGQRLVWQDGAQDIFHCPYHGWKWRLDGTLEDVTDPDDFPQGNPCGKLTLRSVRVDTWGGFVWYTMDDEAPPLLEFLEPVPEIFSNFAFDELIRVRWIHATDLPSNWKMYSDNFNESYHTRTAHPRIVTIVDQDHFTARYEMFPNGHASILQLGRPSLRDVPADGRLPYFEEHLRRWDIDPEAYPDFETRVTEGWKDLKKAKREKWKEKGYSHYEHLSEAELTDNRFMFVFPNVSLTVSADVVTFIRWEPHPDDPEKCSLDYWQFGFPREDGVYRPMFAKENRELKEADIEIHAYDGGRGMDALADQVFSEDIQLSPGQQAGWRSRGYPERPYFAAQETRVARFHEILHDYLNGNPPGR